MTERDPATSLEHDADELEHHLDELDSHISEARKAADARREDLDPAVAGDWDDTRGTAGQGEDPEGAVDEGAAESAEGAEGDDHEPAPSPAPDGSD
jgi:hypothetical protein